MTVYAANFPNPGTSAAISLRLELWEDDVDNALNRTRVGYKAYLRKGAATGGPWDLSGNPGSIIVNGVTLYSGGDTYDFRSPNNAAGATDTILATGYMWITHNSDGTKTITFSASYDGDSTIGDASLSGSRTLPPIPRAPGAPSFTSVSDVTATSFVANYTTPSDIGGGAIDYYRVQYSTDATFATGTVNVDDADGSPTAVTGLTPGGTVYARVAAHNAYGFSDWSNTRTVSVAASGAPKLAVLPRFSGAGFRIICANPFGVGSVTSFTIRRTMTGPGAADPVTVVDTDGLYFDDLVLAPGQTATWQAYATVGGVDTGWSASRTFAYQALTQRPPFRPMWNGTVGQPAPLSSIFTAAWTGTVDISTSTLTAPVVTGWRTFGAGAGGLATGVVTQIPEELALQLQTGDFDVIAVFSSVATGAGVRVGTALSGVGRIDVFPTVSYFGQITAASDVATRLACEIEWLTAENSLISRSRGSVVAVTAGQIVELEAAGTAPAGAVYAAVNVVDVNPGSGWNAEGYRLAGAAQLTASERYPTFDGDTADSPSYTYSWRGTAHASPSLRTLVSTAGLGNALVDPDAPVVVAPPTAPPVFDSAALADVVWRRYVAAVPASELADWINSVPTLTLRTGSLEEREVRIRYWRNADGTAASVWNSDGAEMVSEQIVSYIPANASFFLDGVSGRYWVNLAADTTNADIPADHLVYGPNGGPVEPPVLDCGISYIITLDVPTSSIDGNLTPFLDLTDRVV